MTKNNQLSAPLKEGIIKDKRAKKTERKIHRE